MLLTVSLVPPTVHVLQDSEPAENEEACDHDEAEEGGFMNTGEEWGTDDDEVENTVEEGVTSEENQYQDYCKDCLY